MALALLSQPPAVRHSSCRELRIPPGTHTEGELHGESEADGLGVSLTLVVRRCPVLKCVAGRGHALVIGSTVSVMLALTWAGIEYAWVSPQVLVPLVVGAVGLLTFFAVEYLRRQEQTVRLPRFSCMHLPYLS